MFLVYIRIIRTYKWSLCRMFGSASNIRTHIYTHLQLSVIPSRWEKGLYKEHIFCCGAYTIFYVSLLIHLNSNSVEQIWSEMGRPILVFAYSMFVCEWGWSVLLPALSDRQIRCSCICIYLCMYLWDVYMKNIYVWDILAYIAQLYVWWAFCSMCKMCIRKNSIEIGCRSKCASAYKKCRDG